MTLDQLPDGTEVFLDANILIYHFTADSAYGPASTRFVERIERQQLVGHTSAAVLLDAAHRMMTIEAMERFNWPVAGLAARLRKHRSEIGNLTLFQHAVAQVPKIGIQVHEVTLDMVLAAAKLSRQHELLSGYALIVAIMQKHGLSHLASHDADFDRVASLMRCAPA
jgi:predicted nucleic acid-binding protein